MRLREFTNAEEQLGLLKQIIDCTWRAIADEAAAQKKEQELKRAQAANKPRAKRSAPSVPAKSAPAKPSTPNPAKKTQTSAQNKSDTVTVNPLQPNAMAYKNPHVPIRPYAGYGARKAYGASS